MDSTSLLEVKEEVTYEDEVEPPDTSFEGDSNIIKQEYHCKEEIDLEWDEKDNDYGEDESKLNKISHEAIIKSEADDAVQMHRPTAVETRSSSKTPNAVPQLIQHCCPKCDKLTDIETNFLYRKKKCVTCSTISLLFQCAKCCKRYSHYDSIRYHVLSKCNPKEHHKCPTCPYRTTIRSQLAKHVKRVHDEIDGKSNQLKLKCTICGKEFKYTYSLNRHSKKSCGMKFPKGFVQCENCDRKFKDEDYLEKHAKVCRQEVMVTCDYCGFESKHKRRLILHLKNKHSDWKVFRK